MSMHVWCCCGGCPDAIEITFAGLTASLCGNCIASGPNYLSATDASPLEGVVSGLGLTPASDPCEYISQTIFVGGYMTYTRYSDAGCTTVSGSPIKPTTRRIEVTMNGARVASVSLTLPGAVFGAEDVFSWTGDAALGDTLNNQLTCGGGANPICSGGTAVVTSA